MTEDRSNPFAREDPSDDRLFYAMDRKVVHLEPGAVEALRSAYARLLPPGGRVLDLMSSWRSHLPAGLGRVTGLGLNVAEMAENPQLDNFLVHDLNRLPTLPFADGSFDAVVCAVSVQYLLQPWQVFADARRVLSPGGPLVVSFSNRCFPTKAVAIWLLGDDDTHRMLVAAYLESAGYPDINDEEVPTPDDPLFLVWGRSVWGRSVWGRSGWGRSGWGRSGWGRSGWGPFGRPAAAREVGTPACA